MVRQAIERRSGGNDGNGLRVGGPTEVRTQGTPPAPPRMAVGAPSGTSAGAPVSPSAGGSRWRGFTRRAAAVLPALAAAWLLAIAPAAAEQKRIVTTFTILADIARNVAGDRAIVESITKPGAEIHDYEPTPLDVVRARSGDLVLWNGLGLERWFERFLAGIDVPGVVVSEGIEPIPIAEGAYAGKPNPHAWMSPAAVKVYVENIRRALSELDPDNADAYAANAAAYIEKLDALDAPLRERLDRLPATARVLVSCEGAFSYLARDYGLAETYLWAINADEQGSPQQIRGVIDAVREAAVPVVFCESTVNDRPMRQVASETGARYGGTLYVDSLTPPDGPAPTYLDMMALNAETLTRGFDVAD